ncbi:MAG TPA: helix-turn-helix domain-containing protein [Pseudonocardiaceae bacterium]|nr:helix-turn-helix domain-containing protein [Pseudonocardiaceae bacterium]
MPRPECPLDPSSDDPIVGFARELRALRERAGSPGYRVLAVAAGFSVTTLAEAAGGRSLPTLAVLRAYVRACGGDVDWWEDQWHQLIVAPVEAAPDPDDSSPYVGLREFELEDADRFFGREEITADLVDRVTRQRFVAVFGASGSGKSSLLRAGLRASWTGRSAVITPGSRPLAPFTAALVELLAEPGADGDALLVIDQFEEIFTQCDSTIERDAFVAQVVRTAHQDYSRVRIVLGVRSDFHGQCARHAVLADALRDNQFLVSPMTTEQIRAAITRPAAAFGATVESGLLAAMSPNGRLLLDGGRLWDLTNTRHPRELAGPALPAEARFSMDGSRLVAADENGVVLYDIHGPTPVVLARIDVPAISAVFSPDGTALLIVAPSGPLMLWSTVSRNWLSSLPGTAQNAEFSPDGRFIAAREGSDGTIRLWDVTDPRRPVPTAAIGTGFPFVFSPDGHTLAVLADDGSLRLRETDLRRAVAAVCATVPPLSRSAWQRYLPGRAYSPPCAPAAR